MIAVYTRISSHSQKSDSQRTEIRQWLKGQKLPAKQIHWFEDKESGRSLKRPAFEKLQAAIFDGKVKTVIVWKLDRLARNHREGINVLGDWCAKNVRVVAVTQQIDLQGTVGHVVAGVLFGLAQIELQYTKERQAAGIKVCQVRGHPPHPVGGARAGRAEHPGQRHLPGLHRHAPGRRPSRRHRGPHPEDARRCGQGPGDGPGRRSRRHRRHGPVPGLGRVAVDHRPGVRGRRWLLRRAGLVPLAGVRPQRAPDPPPPPARPLSRPPRGCR